MYFMPLKLSDEGKLIDLQKCEAVPPTHHHESSEIRGLGSQRNLATPATSSRSSEIPYLYPAETHAGSSTSMTFFSMSPANHQAALTAAEGWNCSWQEPYTNL